MASEIVSSRLRGIPIILWLGLFSTTSSWHDLNPSLRMAEADAVAGWSAALGVSLDAPKVNVGFCFDRMPRDFIEVACADRETYSITVSPYMLRPRPPFRSEADLRTVLMHEIGHLLGVNHIPGDPLMAPEPLTHLSRPTPAVLAMLSNPD